MDRTELQAVEGFGVVVGDLADEGGAEVTVLGALGEERDEVVLFRGVAVAIVRADDEGATGGVLEDMGEVFVDLASDVGAVVGEQVAA
jgi:hypothetical protein